uniref:Putative secreted protein n=1 Tax=Anopheles darlingi TaxID=43151 RepID=A0A2M4DK09_ANODA
MSTDSLHPCLSFLVGFGFFWEGSLAVFVSPNCYRHLDDLDVFCLSWEEEWITFQIPIISGQLKPRAEFQPLENCKLLFRADKILYFREKIYREFPAILQSNRAEPSTTRGHQHHDKR